MVHADGLSLNAVSVFSVVAFCLHSQQQQPQELQPESIFLVGHGIDLVLPFVEPIPQNPGWIG